MKRLLLMTISCVSFLKGMDHKEEMRGDLPYSVWLTAEHINYCENVRELEGSIKFLKQYYSSMTNLQKLKYATAIERALCLREAQNSWRSRNYETPVVPYTPKEPHKNDPHFDELRKRFEQEENALMTAQYPQALLDSYLFQGGYVIPDGETEDLYEFWVPYYEYTRHYLMKSGNWLGYIDRKPTQKIREKVRKLDGLPNDLAQNLAYAANLNEAYAHIKGSFVKSLDTKKLERVHAQACHDVLMLELRNKISDE